MKKHIDNINSLNNNSGNTRWIVTRRTFLKTSASVIAGLSINPLSTSASERHSASTISFGIVTDSHYTNANPLGSRYYRESVAKMTECVTLMNDKKVDFLVELGDFKDQDNPPGEQSTISYLRTMEKVFQTFKGDKYHVLGNHDLDSISKEQFLANIRNTNISKDSKYYSFDSNGFHFIVLDANYSANGSDYDHGNFNWTDANIPKTELNWLKRDLTATSKPSIVFIHQQLDGEGSHYVNNASEVRRILQKHQGVLAVFQGHNHAGHYSYIEGIHYYTLKAMVEGSGEENNSYAIIEVHNDHSITVTGYRRALSKELEKA